MFQAETQQCEIVGCTLQTLILHEEGWMVMTMCPTHYEEQLEELENEDPNERIYVLTQEEWEEYMLTRSANNLAPLETEPDN